jgi:hypothetical protein
MIKILMMWIREYLLLGEKFLKIVYVYSLIVVTHGEALIKQGLLYEEFWEGFSFGWT